jgi:hypothetical protein
VGDHDEIISAPRRHVVEDFDVADGRAAADLRSIFSFPGRLSDQAQVGRFAKARERLERVIPRKEGDPPPSGRVGRPGDQLVARRAGQ